MNDNNENHFDWDELLQRIQLKKSSPSSATASTGSKKMEKNAYYTITWPKKWLKRLEYLPLPT